MNLFEIVKYGVSCREAAELYGVEVNRYGMALCPFHTDRHPRLYVADDHYYCFACGEHGDVIDFVGKLFPKQKQLRPAQTMTAAPCKCCGQEFASKRTNTLFCGPNCRAKFYRQEAAEGRSRACTCENCGKEFITARSDVKYCSDDCRYAAQIKRQGARKKALREAKNEEEAKTA